MAISRSTSVFETPHIAQAVNTCESVVHTPRGDYLVQVAWPVKWNDDRTRPQEELDNDNISAIYVTDGNAYFAGVVDIARRLEATDMTRAIIIGIGYPMGPMGPTRSIYNKRRGPDLTPPSRDGTYDPPLDGDGNPQLDITFGEADDLLAFLRDDVMRWVETELFPELGFSSSGNATTSTTSTRRKALIGHSYGGLFTLNALYTHPETFDVYVAASADIGFNKGKFIAEQEAAFLARTDLAVARPPALVLTHGDAGPDLVQREGESDARFQKRVANAELARTPKATEGLVQRLTGLRSVRAVTLRVLPGEDHGSASLTGFQHGMREFLTTDL